MLFRFLSSFSVCFTVMSLWQFRMVYSYAPLTVSYGLQLCPFDSFVWFTVMSLSPFRIVYSYVPLTVSYGLQFCPFDSFVWFTVMSLWQFRMVYSYVPLTVLYGLQLCPFDSFICLNESVYVFLSFIYICYCRWRSSYQDGRVEIPLTGLTLPYFYVCPKPGPGFSVSYVVVFFMFQSFEIWADCLFCCIGGIVDHHCCNDGIVDRHCCKLFFVLLYWWNCWPSLL